MHTLHVPVQHHAAYQGSIRGDQAGAGTHTLVAHAAARDASAARTAPRRRLYHNKHSDHSIVIISPMGNQPGGFQGGAGVADRPPLEQMQQANQMEDAQNPWLMHGHAAHVAATSALIASSLPVIGGTPDALLPVPISTPPESFSQVTTNRSRAASRTGAWFNPLSLPPATLVKAVYGLAKSGQVPTADWMQRCLIACERLFITPTHPANNLPIGAMSWVPDGSASAHRSAPGLVDPAALRTFPWTHPTQHPGGHVPLDAHELCMLAWGITRLHQLQQSQERKQQRHSSSRGRSRQQHVKAGAITDTAPSQPDSTQAIDATWSPWPQPSQAWVDALCAAALPLIQQPPNHPASDSCTTASTARVHPSSTSARTAAGDNSGLTDTTGCDASTPPVLISGQLCTPPWHDHGVTSATDDLVSINSQGLLSSLRSTVQTASRATLDTPSPRLCATIPWTLAVLGCQPSHSWCEAWLAASQPLLQRMSGQDVGQIAWAWVRLHAVPPSNAWMSQLISRAEQLAAEGKLNPQDLSNLMWACARLGYAPANSLISTALAPAALQQLAASQDGCKAMDMAQLMWALGKLGIQPPPEVMHALLRITLQWKETLSEQDLVNCLWAIGKLGYNPTPSIRRMLVRTVGWRVACKQLTPKGLPTLLSALTKLPWRLPDLLTAKLIELAAVFSQMLTLEGVTLVLYWAAKKRIEVAPWHLVVLMRAVHCQDDLGIQTTTAAGASSSNGPPIAASMSHATDGHFSEARPERGGKSDDATLRYEAARELWARSNPGTAAMLMYSMAMLCYRPSSMWMRQYWAGTLQLLPQASANDLCLLMGGQASLGLRPPRYWLRTALARAKKLYAGGGLSEEHKNKLSNHMQHWLPGELRQTTAQG